ncbi:MAG: hypothetical protein AAGI08_04150 [Bacteroidota bacterium]
MSYQPIACSFHDVLESLAIRRLESEITFYDAAGLLVTRTARIDDVYSTDSHEEFVRLSTGEVIRLDKLVRAGGHALAGFC